MQAKDAAPERRKATRRRACPVHERASARQASCFNRFAAVTCSAIAQTAIVAVPSAHIPRLSKHHGLALALPSPAHAGRQAIRLRSEECRCEATLLRRLHL